MSNLFRHAAGAGVSSLALVLALGPCPAAAQSSAAPAPLPELRVEARRAAPPPHTARPAARQARPREARSQPPAMAPQSPPRPFIGLNDHTMAVTRAASADTAQIFAAAPGMALASGGGISSLPVIRGLADERNRILLGGIDITAACANHMNPALSYSTPALVGKAEVLSANIPVSKGGDAIGGTIIVSPPDPQFAPGGAGKELVAGGSLTSAFNTQGKRTTLGGEANMATRAFSLTYAGAWTRADNLRSGKGREVLSSNYSAQNHALMAAYRNDGHLITLRGTYQDIPRQAFANQRMDMLGNEGRTLSAGYEGQFGWGKLEARAFWHGTRHYMNLLADKGGSTPTRGMPMYTEGQDFGYSLQGEIKLEGGNLLRLGNEFHGQRLDDWWPPVARMMTTMCCNTFWNINNGQRDRFGTFAELETRWNKEWTSIVGVRNDIIHMDAGRVQGYSPVDTGRNMMGGMTMVNYLADSTAFNAAKRAKTDINFDFSTVLRYEPGKAESYEAGFTRKTRSPSLYERYAWSKGSPAFGMSPNMVNWFGDANGYVGAINLKPELANTASVSASWRDAANSSWEFKVSPYLSYVQNYIDADRLWDQRGRMGAATPFVTLQFANHDTLLTGVDVSGRFHLLHDPAYGHLGLSGVLGYVRGRNLDTRDNLYHIMPINGKIALEHALPLYGGTLSSAIEVQAVGAKDQVNAPRREITTPAYALVNLRTAYQYANLRFDLGIENLFDRQYYLPLGGANFSAYKAAGGSGRLAAMPGPGRGIYGGMSVKF